MPSRDEFLILGLTSSSRVARIKRQRFADDQSRTAPGAIVVVLNQRIRCFTVLDKTRHVTAGYI